MRKLILVVLVFFCASIAAAQVSVGSMPAISGPYRSAGISTIIDLSHPATGDGALTSASVRWQYNCASAFKLKFLHSNSLTTYSVFAERGPFDAVTGTNMVTLSPPVTVQAGDLIAITQTSMCTGGYVFSPGSDADSTMFFLGEIPNSGALNGSLERNHLLNARATSGPNFCEGVIAGAGSLAGAFGSHFRTAMQITNRDSKVAAGTLVFHPAGTAGSASDPSLAYSVPANSVVSFTDVVQQMGQSGLGSIDVISTSGSRPLFTVRVFNDAGSAGSSGFTEEIVPLENVLHELDDAFITMPADPTNFRMNVGIRTLDAGATLQIFVVDANGSTLLQPVEKAAYPANYFEQPTLQQFINNVAPVPNGVVRIRVINGSAIVYATTTDNRTNDSSIDFATHE
ncbi:MAG TPA: hypothetical protein VL284_05290 [Thermoanaerobaculia bacterium]|nr:hypothetical protein [Thermoanaerobaculia bacterium]